MPTRRQQEIWEVIRSWYSEKGYAPTLDEIAQSIGINTKSTVHQHVKALIKEGRLLAANGKRAYKMPEVENDGHPQMALPLAGQIAAGKPITAIEGRDEISPTEIFTGPGRYALKVRGDSMVDIGVIDGDYVVIERKEEARDGEIVVALVEREEATLKRIYNLEDGKVELRPENKEMQPMVYPANSVQVQGTMVGLFRSY